jgi:hypothetical protein
VVVLVVEAVAVMVVEAVAIAAAASGWVGAWAGEDHQHAGTGTHAA